MAEENTLIVWVRKGYLIIDGIPRRRIKGDEDLLSSRYARALQLMGYVQVLKEGVREQHIRE